MQSARRAGNAKPRRDLPFGKDLAPRRLPSCLIKRSSMFDMLAPEIIADPYPLYRHLRRRHPVYQAQDGSWLLTRHDDVSWVLRDRRFLKDARRVADAIYGEQSSAEPIVAMLGKSALMADPPSHGRVRGLMMKAFAGRRIGDQRSHIQQVADRLIDRIETSGRFNIVRDYAYPLSMTVICDMLGIPEDVRPDAQEYFGFGAAALNPLPLERSEIDQLNGQIVALDAHFRAAIARRRSQPADDLISAMMQAEENGDRFSEEELVANLMLLFIAGHETTANFIGNALWALHRHPEQLQRLREEPGIAANAVEELLRFESPVRYVARTPLEDVEINGKAIRRGDWVFAFVAAGNRDPAVYAAPDRLDIGRSNVRPLSFGGGAHFCVGAQLARLEAEIAITTLIRRLPPLEIDSLENPKWRAVMVFRMLNELHASW